jgi:hypothetical protein
MARDLSARPHEILGLKIKDIMFKTAGNGKQYAEVLVNGKTGTRHIPLIQSIPYIKDWLSNHPSRNNTNSPIFVSWDRRYNITKNRPLTTSGLFKTYEYYQKEFFPKLLEDPSVSGEDKEKIRNLLSKPFNPYIRRHSGLTEKSRKLKSSTLNQYAGWSMNSNMVKKYTHYYGNEASEDLLEAYDIVSATSIERGMLNPKICPHCSEGNTQDAKFCSKCKMIMSYEGYQEALESEKKKEWELEAMKEQFSGMQSQIQSLIMAFANMKEQTQFDSMAKTLYDSHILGKEAATAPSAPSISAPTITPTSMTTLPRSAEEATTTTPTDSLESEEEHQHNQQQQQKKAETHTKTTYKGSRKSRLPCN